MAATEIGSLKKYLIGTAVGLSLVIATQTVGLLRWTAVIETRITVVEGEVNRLRDRVDAYPSAMSAAPARGSGTKKQ